jgi:uncharacterized protein (TIGR03083 family)
MLLPSDGDAYLRVQRISEGSGGCHLDLHVSDLADSEWELPTGCPGWTVKDHVSHLVDYEARALGGPGPRHEPGPLPHVKNELGMANEIGVDARRPVPGAEVLVDLWLARVPR